MRNHTVSLKQYLYDFTNTTVRSLGLWVRASINLFRQFLALFSCILIFFVSFLSNILIFRECSFSRVCAKSLASLFTSLPRFSPTTIAVPIDWSYTNTAIRESVCTTTQIHTQRAARYLCTWVVTHLLSVYCCVGVSPVGRHRAAHQIAIEQNCTVVCIVLHENNSHLIPHQKELVSFLCKDFRSAPNSRRSHWWRNWMSWIRMVENDYQWKNRPMPYPKNQTLEQNTNRTPKSVSASPGIKMSYKV